MGNENLVGEWAFFLKPYHGDIDVCMSNDNSAKNPILMIYRRKKDRKERVFEVIMTIAVWEKSNRLF